MIKYAKLEMNEDDYNELKRVQVLNDANIKEHFIGSRRKMYSKHMMIATLSSTQSLHLGGITQGQFNAFLGGFSKQLYKQFDKNQDLYNLHVDFEGMSREKNHDNWDSLKEGDFFYNIDLSSAYWQIAHKLGYINDKTFDKYIKLDEYKQAKRLCISFLARVNRMKYYIEDDSYEISCDTSALRKVYENIRHYLYSIIQECVGLCDNWLEYNIDGVTVINSNVAIVKKYFIEQGFLFKTTECRKINDLEYLYGSTQRRFKNKQINR